MEILQYGAEFAVAAAKRAAMPYAS